MQNKGRSSYILLFLLLAAAALIYIFRQNIQDYIKLRGYMPSPEIVTLADNTSMLSSSRRLFYVNHPEVADRTTFNNNCRDDNHVGEETIVLGCYLTGQNGIYVLDVDDERLNGIKEVTAAHELLHAAYERLSSKERERIDELTQEVFDSLTSTRIKDTVELYRSQDPSIVPNELHSILGTEVRDLPEELEEYYRLYFSDRSKIVAYSEQYEQAFVERRNAIRDFDIELAELKGTIDSLSSSLNQRDDDLKNMRNNMNSLRANGQVEEYNALVPQYNSLVNNYNADIDRLSSLIVKYNEIVQKRNSIAAEEAELVKAIDSREVVPEQH